MNTILIGNTKKMADAIVEGARSRNVDAVAMNFHEAKIEELKSADAIALGSSTFHYKMLPPMEKFIESLSKINAKGKFGGAFGSYGWSGEAVAQMRGILQAMNVELVGDGLRVTYVPGSEALQQSYELGQRVAERMKERVGRE